MALPLYIAHAWSDAEASSEAPLGRLQLPVRSPLFADKGVANKRQLVTGDTRLLDVYPPDSGPTEAPATSFRVYPEQTDETADS